MIGIYKITNPKGKVYIGQSINIKSRFKQYKFKNFNSQQLLFRSFNKYGYDNHTFEVIEECEVDKLNERERYWQEYYDVLNRDKGLNLVLVSSKDKKMVMSEDTKKKISKGNKGKIRSDKFRKDVSNRVSRGNNSNSELIFNTETGIYYDCFADASDSIGKKSGFLRDRLSSLSCYNNTSFIYACEIKHNNYLFKLNIKNNRSKYVPTKQHVEKIKRKIKENINNNIYNSGSLVLDTYTGVYYKSIKEACFCYNIKYDTMKRYLKGNLRNRTNLELI